MPRLPDASALGMALPDAARSIASYQGGQAEAGAMDMGAGIAKAGEGIVNAAETFQKQANDVWLRDAGTSLLLDMNKEASEYRKKEGMDAVAGYEGHTQALVAMRDRAIEAAPNPMAKRALAEQANYTFTRMVMGAQSYSAQQFKVGQERSLKTSNEALTTAGVNFQNDPDFIAKTEAGIRANALEAAKLRGLNDEEAGISAQSAVGAFYQTVLSDMATRDPQRAMAMFASVRSKMDAGSQLHLDRLLEPKARAAAADAWVSGEMGGAPPQIGGDTMARVEMVRAGLVKRGMNPIAATAFAANAVRESSGMPNAPAEDAGAGGGVFQWRGPRSAAFRSQYGVDPKDASLDQQLDFTMAELNGSENAAWQKIQGAKTPAEAAAMVSTHFLRPRDTAGEASKRSAIAASMMPNAAPAAGPVNGAFPDESALLERAQVQFGIDPEMLGAVVARIKQKVSLYNLQTATERKAIGSQFTDAMAALEAGKDDIYIPEDRIRAVFPPVQADEIVEKLATAKIAGQLFAGIRTGTPEDLRLARADLASGQGPMSAMLRLRSGQVQAKGEGGEGSGSDTPPQFALRQKLLAHFDQMVNARNQALQTDPAGYVLGLVQAGQLPMSDEVKNDPAQRAQAVLAAQEQMGVPEWQRHVLSAGQAADMVRTITTTDPAKADMGAQIDGMAKQYGALWPSVWKDLVTVGKLPGEYLVLGSMTAPGQISGRQDLQRALGDMAQHGGLDWLKKGAGPDKVRDIDKNLPAALDDFRATTAWNIGGAELFSRVSKAAEVLAYRYAMQGKSDAVETAVRMVAGEKYDFSGTMRAPKGLMPAVQDAAYATQSALKPDDLAPMAGSTALTQAERQQEAAIAIRRGQWVPTAEDDGVTLMLPLKDGMRVAKRADGSPITIKFAGLPVASNPFAKFGYSGEAVP